MYIAKRGNQKLGRRVHVISRPVGVTCPNNCPFLQEDSSVRSYGEFTELRFNRAKKAPERNLRVSAEQLYTAIIEANENQVDFRIHERGDFKLDGKVDTWYVGQLLRAIKKAIKEKTVPKIWFYTHVYSKIVAKLGRLQNVAAYASVHNAKDIKQAAQKGFTLFAYVLNVRKAKGGSRDFPSHVDVPSLGRTLVCPEQRFGKDKVTCQKCRWCIEGKGNVVFLEFHGKKVLTD